MVSSHPIDKQEVMAYLDGELPVGRAMIVAAHLEQCAECRLAAEDLRLVSRQLLAWQVEPPPAGLTERVTAAVEAPAQRAAQAEPKKSLWGGMLSQQPLVRPWVWGVAGGLVLVAASWLLVPNLLIYRGRSPAPYSGSGYSGVGGGGGFAPPQGIPLSPMQDQRQTTELLPAPSPKEELSRPAGPMIVHRAELAVVTKEFDKAREAIERSLRQHRGYAGELNVDVPAGAGRTLTATLRVPTDQFDAVLAELKKLGRVEHESQAGEDVTKQYVDLDARLSNARNTEQRLIDLLRQRTGKVADILVVEQEIARVRGEIESMEAEKKSLENRAAFATLQLKLSEEYKAQLEVAPPSAGTRLRNAAVEGYRSAVQGALDLVLFLLSTGPSLVLWLLILFALLWPGRALWRRLRPN